MNSPATQLEETRARYNRLASFYPLLELLFLLPIGIRTHAADALALNPGDVVLEVGCGTGRNFPYLLERTGRDGAIIGVDCSDGMLAQAQALCRARGWNNVTLLQQDAARMDLPSPVDGILFSLSYTVMPSPEQVLARAWQYLRPNRFAVIVDARVTSKWLAALRPLIHILNKATVAGDPTRRPWDELRRLTSEIAMREMLFGAYYICRGMKRQLPMEKML